jgi:hypothetical protein
MYLYDIIPNLFIALIVNDQGRLLTKSLKDNYETNSNY